jgi:hypothetical protein
MLHFKVLLTFLVCHLLWKGCAKVGSCPIGSTSGFGIVQGSRNRIGFLWINSKRRISLSTTSTLIKWNISSKRRSSISWMNKEVLPNET